MPGKNRVLSNEVRVKSGLFFLRLFSGGLIIELFHSLFTAAFRLALGSVHTIFRRELNCYGKVQPMRFIKPRKERNQHPMGKYRKLFGKRRPNRKRIFIAAAAGTLVICAAGAAIVSAFGARGQTEDEEEDALAEEQERISRIYTEEYQESVQTRLDNAKNSGNYTEDAMLIEPNPYGTNSLSLYVYFKTEDAARVSYTVSVEDGDISDFSASPASEEAYGTEHEFQVTGLVPDMENTVTFTVSYEDGSVKEYQYTEETADTAGSEEVRLRTEDAVEDASEKLENGLYVILGNDSDELDFMYYYDNDGVLRGEVPLIGYRSHRLLFREGLMYYSISETKIAAVNSLGMAEKIYDTGTYELHHDYAFDADGNLLVLATDTEKDSVEDIVIRLDGESGEITGVLDLGEVFPDYKESCSVAEDGDLDWIHINTLQYLEDETLILSSRETSTILKISGAFSEPAVDYMIGAEEFWEGTGYEELLLEKDESGGTFSDTGGQHTVTYVEDDTLPEGQYYLYMFNNNFGAGESRDFDWTVIEGIETSMENGETSRYYRYLVDETEGTYTLADSFDIPFSAYVSSAQEYGENIVIDSGMAGVFGEYDSEGNLIRERVRRL